MRVLLSSAAGFLRGGGYTRLYSIQQFSAGDGVHQRGYTRKFLSCIFMHKTLSLGYTRAENEDYKKNSFSIRLKLEKNNLEWSCECHLQVFMFLELVKLQSCKKRPFLIFRTAPKQLAM